MTFTINNQLSSQVQRLVRERPTYDNLYQIYGGRNVGRQYTNARSDFQHQLVSSILCPPGYQTGKYYLKKLEFTLLLRASKLFLAF